MQIRYFYHDSFMVSLGPRRVLIFDYYKDKPYRGSWENGVVVPADLVTQDVSVFVTHRHSDHYNPCIFNWRYDIREIRYILSDDIVGVGQEVVSVRPDHLVEVDQMKITTFQSNDEGVAFLIKSPEATIFHAGDLGWWDWQEESLSFRKEMKNSYFKELEKLVGTPIDVAFLPLDPRLGDSYAKGFDYFMSNVGARYCVPMHFWDDYSVIGRLMADPISAPYRDAIVPYGQRGDIILDVDDPHQLSR